MTTGKISVLIALVLLHTALGSPLLVVTITQISTFVAVLPYQTATRWTSITTYVPANPQSTDLVLSTFSEALLSRVTPHQTFLITSTYLTTLVGLETTAASSTGTSTSLIPTGFARSSTGTPTNVVPTGVAPSSTTDAAHQAASSGQNFPVAAIISISVVLTTLLVGFIAFYLRQKYRRKNRSATKTLAFHGDDVDPPPLAKLSMSKSSHSSGYTSWTGLQHVGGVVHPGTPVGLSLNPIPHVHAHPILQYQPQEPYSSVGYSSRGSNAFDMSDAQRTRSQTWGSTTTAIQSPEQHADRFTSTQQHPSGYRSAQQRISFPEYQQNEPTDYQNGQDSHWDEAIRRLNSLGQNPSPPPNIVQGSASMLNRVSSPDEQMRTSGLKPVSPVSQMTSPEIATGGSSRVPSPPTSIEDERAQTLATLEGTGISRRYSPSVYSRMADGAAIADVLDISREESLEWAKMFDDRHGGDHRDRLL